MPEVRVGENESIESALKRFKKKIQKAGIFLKSKDVRFMKNQVSKENANLKLHENAEFRFL